MDTGYFHRSLVEKLGIKPNTSVAFLNAPAIYQILIEQLPDGVDQRNGLQPKTDFIQFFTKDKAELEQIFPRLKEALDHSGMLWISWPKKTSKISTDLDENRIMQIGLENGLVDVKVISIDEIWSGLKFIYRLKDRK